MPARIRLVSARLLIVLIHSGSALANPPNVVLILAEDLGDSDTAPYRSAFAEQGIRFSNYHTAASGALTRGRGGHPAVGGRGTEPRGHSGESHPVTSGASGIGRIASYRTSRKRQPETQLIIPIHPGNRAP